MSCDLHCHTKLSDGSLGIEELITLAKRRKLSAISITDHDTTAGATRGVVIGRRLELPVIPGVELSAFDPARGRKVHLLCYQCAIPDRLEGLCRRNIESKKKAAADMMRRVMRYYPITPEMVIKCASGSTNVYKQHIMHALIDAGYAGSIFGSVFNKLFGPDGAARIDAEFEDVRDVLALIHSAEGIAVLAHPYFYDSLELMEELTALGLDGVEVYSSHHTEEQQQSLLAYTKANQLLATGGTDFHGMYIPQPRPVGSVTVSNEAVQELLGYKNAQKRAAPRSALL